MENPNDEIWNSVEEDSLGREEKIAVRDSARIRAGHWA